MFHNIELDRIVLEYYEIPFEEFAQQQKLSAKRTEVYSDILCNSVLFHGKRMDYMSFLNNICSDVQDKSSELNTFQSSN